MTDGCKGKANDFDASRNWVWEGGTGECVSCKGECAIDEARLIGFADMVKDEALQWAQEFRNEADNGFQAMVERDDTQRDNRQARLMFEEIVAGNPDAYIVQLAKEHLKELASSEN